MNLIEESSIREEYNLKRFLSNENALLEQEIPRAYFIGQSLNNFLIYNSKIVDLNIVQGTLSGGQIVNSQLLGMSTKGSLIESVSFINSHLPKMLLSHTTFKNCYFKDCTISAFKEFELGDSVLFESCLFDQTDPTKLGQTTLEHCIVETNIDEPDSESKHSTVIENEKKPEIKSDRFKALDL